MKKKISIDLDVVTVGLWKKKDLRKQEALKMLKRTMKKIPEGVLKKERFQVPPVILEVQKTKSLFKNFGEIASILRRELKHNQLNNVHTLTFDTGSTTAPYIKSPAQVGARGQLAIYAQRTDAGNAFIVATKDSLGAESNRFLIEGGVDTATAAWSSIVHSGLKLGGALDANEQTIDNVAYLNLDKSGNTQVNWLEKCCS